MTLRKVTIDNSVKFIPSTNTSLGESSHNYILKTVSNPKKQKKLSQSNWKLIKDFKRGEKVRILEWVKHWYFLLEKIQVF